MAGKRAKKTVTYSDGFRLADGLYSSFLLYNPTTKRNERFSIDPPTKSLEVAKSQKRNQEIKFGILQTRAKKRFEFLQKYHKQEKLFDEYTQHLQKTAKRSWQDSLSRMRCYVFPYFIGKLNLNHPSLWYEYWQPFQNSLKTPIRKNTKTKELSVNSKNLIIRAANSFISFVELNEGGSPIKRLPEFKYEEAAQRGVESVYSDSEIEAVYKEFKSHKEDKYAALWLVLANTGLRLGEAIGLMLNDVVFNSVPTQEKWIFTALKDKTELFGYILLKSQPLDTNNLVSKNGKVERIPLKKRKRIAPEFNRIIPLINMSVATTLKNLKSEVSEHELLFEGCTYRQFYTLFNSIKKKLKLKSEKDIHSLRHTFATKFTKLCDGDPRLAEKVLGHSDPKMTQRYNHLANELESASNAKNDSNEIKPLKIV